MSRISLSTPSPPLYTLSRKTATPPHPALTALQDGYTPTAPVKTLRFGGTSFSEFYPEFVEKLRQWNSGYSADLNQKVSQQSQQTLKGFKHCFAHALKHKDDYVATMCFMNQLNNMPNVKEMLRPGFPEQNKASWFHVVLERRPEGKRTRLVEHLLKSGLIDPNEVLPAANSNELAVSLPEGTVLSQAVYNGDSSIVKAVLECKALKPETVQACLQEINTRQTPRMSDKKMRPLLEKALESARNNTEKASSIKSKSSSFLSTVLSSKSKLGGLSNASSKLSFVKKKLSEFFTFGASDAQFVKLEVMEELNISKELYRKINSRSQKSDFKGLNRPLTRLLSDCASGDDVRKIHQFYINIRKSSASNISKPQWMALINAAILQSQKFGETGAEKTLPYPKGIKEGKYQISPGTLFDFINTRFDALKSNNKTALFGVPPETISILRQLTGLEPLPPDTLLTPEQAAIHMFFTMGEKAAQQLGGVAQSPTQASPVQSLREKFSNLDLRSNKSNEQLEQQTVSPISDQNAEAIINTICHQYKDDNIHFKPLDTALYLYAKNGQKMNDKWKEYLLTFYLDTIRNPQALQAGKWAAFLKHELSKSADHAPYTAPNMYPNPPKIPLTAQPNTVIDRNNTLVVNDDKILNKDLLETAIAYYRTHKAPSYKDFYKQFSGDDISALKQLTALEPVDDNCPLPLPHATVRKFFEIRDTLRSSRTTTSSVSATQNTSTQSTSSAGISEEEEEAFLNDLLPSTKKTTSNVNKSFNQRSNTLQPLPTSYSSQQMPQRHYSLPMHIIPAVDWDTDLQANSVDQAYWSKLAQPISNRRFADERTNPNPGVIKSGDGLMRNLPLLKAALLRYQTRYAPDANKHARYERELSKFLYPNQPFNPAATSSNQPDMQLLDAMIDPAVVNPNILLTKEQAIVQQYMIAFHKTLTS